MVPVRVEVGFVGEAEATILSTFGVVVSMTMPPESASEPVRDGSKSVISTSVVGVVEERLTYDGEGSTSEDEVV